MTNESRHSSRWSPVPLAVAALLAGGAGLAHADALEDLTAVVRALQQQVREQKQEILLLKKQQDAAASQAAPAAAAAAAAAAPAAAAVAVAAAQVAIDESSPGLVMKKNGWTAQLSGLLDARSGRENFNTASGRDSENTTRVRSGFNPSKIEVTVTAPESNGINISGYFQLASSISGSKTVRTGEQIEVRGFDIAAATQYGTVSAGRNFGIYGMYPLANDTGSVNGVGYLCVGPDGNGPNCGHIGTGYTWPDFIAGIRYASPRVAGLQARVGIYDPVETAFGVPGGAAPFVAVSDLAGNFNGLFTNFTSIGDRIQTRTPMFQGDITWAAPTMDIGTRTKATAFLWTGALNQDVKDSVSRKSTNIKGYNVGGRFTLAAPVGVFGLTGSYERTHGVAEGFIGFGARCNATAGCDTAKGDQYYFNLDYKASKLTLGTSYGRGTEDANAVVGNAHVRRRLYTVYAQYQLTPQLNVSIEGQNFDRNTGTANSGAPAGIFPGQERYNAVLAGAQFKF